METLTTHFKKLLRETDTGFNRYLYSDINWRNRIIGIKGPRGVGKTTLMLQHIKQEMNPDDVLYVNADDIYFSSHAATACSTSPGFWSSVAYIISTSTRFINTRSGRGS